MGKLHLRGRLKLEGDLRLSTVVLAGEDQLVVPLDPTGAAHSLDATPPIPSNEPKSGAQVWLSESANRRVLAGGRPALTANALTFKQGPGRQLLSGQAAGGKHEIMIHGALALALGDRIVVGATSMTLTESGQS